MCIVDHVGGQGSTNENVETQWKHREQNKLELISGSIHFTSSEFSSHWPHCVTAL